MTHFKSMVTNTAVGRTRKKSAMRAIRWQEVSPCLGVERITVVHVFIPNQNHYRQAACSSQDWKHL